MNILGVFHSYSDPSAALLRDEEVAAFVEEERLVRIKHAAGAFPIRAVGRVLEDAGVSLGDVDYIAQAWDCRKYDDGTISRHYESLNERYPTVEADHAYQQRLLSFFTSANQRRIIEESLRREFGDLEFPEIRFLHHHFSHACPAFFGSGFDDAVILTIDGCGEEISTAFWLGTGQAIRLLHEIKIPHSLGWFYSAFTEYLGFDAYDGEYKVMGLAAYGRRDPALEEKVAKILWYDGRGGFGTDPMILSRGDRRFSYYYPDTLPAHFGRAPRARTEPLDEWHKNLAFAVQNRLEEIVFAMVRHWTRETGVRNLCISGGVGLNVKLNGRLFASGLVDDLFAYPLCSDLGQSIGAAMTLRHELCGLRKQRLRHLFLGPGWSDAEIRKILEGCKVPYQTDGAPIERRVAELLARGQVVGWFQGRMEAGPRALGARSILADPRTVASRDRVNAVIKYRELWRPFCPSMTRAGADRYLVRSTYAPFMILTFEATDRAREEVPAIVHVDGTCRPQVVDPEVNPRYHALLEEFEHLAGVPCLLNTSFNVKGEPIVCTPQDALRTFYATGMDALALGDCLITK